LLLFDTLDARGRANPLAAHVARPVTGVDGPHKLAMQTWWTNADMDQSGRGWEPEPADGEEVPLSPSRIDCAVGDTMCRHYFRVSKAVVRGRPLPHEQPRSLSAVQPNDQPVPSSEECSAEQDKDDDEPTSERRGRVESYPESSNGSAEHSEGVVEGRVEGVEGVENTEASEGANDAVPMLPPRSVNAVCEPWCSEPCTALNGDNLQAECGGCNQEWPCNPRAAGFARQPPGRSS